MGENSLSNINGNGLKIFLKNLIIEFLISILLMLVLAILLSKTDLEEKIIPTAIIFISAFSILVGGFLTGRKVNFKGIVLGSLEGILYMTILYFISSVSTSNFELGKESIIMLIVGIFAGAIRRNCWG